MKENLNGSLSFLEGVSLYYTYFKNIGNKILIRYKDQDSDRTISKTITDYQPSLFTKTEEQTEWKSVYGYQLKKIEFDSIRAAKDFAKQYKNVDNFVLEGNSNYGNQFIIELFDGKKPDYQANYIKRCLVDIEVHAPEFPKPEEANWPITGYTIYNNVTNKFYTAVLHNGVEDKDWNWDQSKSPEELRDLDVEFKLFFDEESLVREMLQHMNIHQYDIISGWNSEGFDIPYIINRSNKILGESFTKTMLSPFKTINSYEKINGHGNTFTKFEILGLAHLDYLQLYKKHTYTPRESYKLDFIANAELGSKKLSYEESGSLENLYVDDLQLYVDYNIQDVNLIKQLDEKLKLFDLVFALTYYGLSNFEDTMGTVMYWEQLIAKFLYTKNMVPLFNKVVGESRDFEGAYVKEPIKGFHDWIFSIDLASLYPHIIQQLNLGVETLISDEDLPDEIADLKTATSFEKILKKECDLSILKEYDLSMSPSYAYYKKDEMSFLSELMRELYAQRKVFKKQMLEAQQKKVDATNSKDKKHWEAIESAMNNMQLGMKICLNSLYGALGQKSFLYYKVQNAEAITMFGQMINRWTGTRIEQYLQKLFRTDCKYWVYGDTDSLYISIKSLVDTLPKSYDERKIVETIIEFLNEILMPEVESICQELCDYLNNYEQRMLWDPEIVSDKAAWVGKKKYVMHVLNSEGVDYIGKDKYKIMGMESVKSSTPAWSRESLTELYKLALTTDESTIHSHIEETRNKFDQMPVYEIAIPRGTNDIEKYVDEQGMPAKGCPKHVRAAIVHNNFLSEHSINRIPKIQSGDKIKFVELKLPNPMASPVVGFVEYPPKEMNLDKYVDYDLIFESAFEKPAKIFLDAIEWNLEETNTLF